METPEIVRDDLIIDETEEDYTPLDITKESRKVESKSLDVPIDVLDKWFRDGKLIVRPDFQRQFVWDAKKINRLIESVFLDFPIPVIYFVEEEDSKLTVIDGQQRICSLLKFIQNKHQLKNLVVCTELNGKTWKELSEDQQRQFQNFSLNIVKITKNSHKDIRFEIFERLNTGSVKLNDQEIRNCIYRGKYNDLLKELAKNEDFQFILDSPNDHTRMLDSQLILRFFAFYHKTNLNYKAPMKQFLNSEMEKSKQLDPNEIDKLYGVFKKSVELIRTIFGKKAFRLMTFDNSMDFNGPYKGTKFNQGLFDILMNGFTFYEKRQVQPHSESIVRELQYLSTKDKEFIDSISGTGTDSTLKVRKKFAIWLRSLDNILKSPTNEPRAFPKQLKEQLFETHPICALCQQLILDIDDAEVDHIHCYSKGGETIPSNARLTHRFCNRQRGSKDSIATKPVESIQPVPQKSQPFLNEPIPQFQSQSYPKFSDNSEKTNTTSHENTIVTFPKRVIESTIPPKAKITRKRGAITRIEYFFPLLEYLINNNGTMTNDDAYNVIKIKFGTFFKEIDFGILQDGLTLRWQKNVDWAKSIMKANGWLKRDKPREWKITDYGKEIHKELKENPRTIIKVSENKISFVKPKKIIDIKTIIDKSQN